MGFHWVKALRWSSRPSICVFTSSVLGYGLNALRGISCFLCLGNLCVSFRLILCWEMPPGNPKGLFSCTLVPSDVGMWVGSILQGEALLFWFLLGCAVTRSPTDLCNLSLLNSCGYWRACAPAGNRIGHRKTIFPNLLPLNGFIWNLMYLLFLKHLWFRARGFLSLT